jgi:hypothetical protein
MLVGHSKYFISSFYLYMGHNQSDSQIHTSQVEFAYDSIELRLIFFVIMIEIFK